MKSWGNRAALCTNVMQRLLSVRDGSYPPPELPDHLTTWLAQLTLLYGMPVEYMVADNRMLPIESMRFFYIDRNWLDRLVDGALSVGVLSSKEQVFNETFYEEIYAQIDAKQLLLRSELREEAPPVTTMVGGGMTGMIFRSEVVAGWPGLEVEATSSGTPVTILRMDRLSDNVLLIIWDGIPDKVNVIEPSEGLAFGVTRNSGATTFTIALRGLGFPTNNPYPAGQQIMNGPSPVTAAGSLRSGAEPGVIDISTLRENIIAAMPANALPNGKLTPGAMAIQLVRAAGNQEYNLDAASLACDPPIPQS
ncbi:hypothetical protein [Chitinophaga sp. Cy-1792]|uniref:hypothetical protein n=1 Tax=Chitinophaga sp. Cy-1792 TaxID=2608339 RepID=UPI00142425F0|nr:hypothetical protein [Chitinophaga sp. Cy-1792]NIG56677.1 hypothetical protein [Chitinophaga sp. Cy-1792]